MAGRFSVTGYFSFPPNVCHKPDGTQRETSIMGEIGHDSVNPPRSLDGLEKLYSPSPPILESNEARAFSVIGII